MSLLKTPPTLRLSRCSSTTAAVSRRPTDRDGMQVDLVPGIIGEARSEGKKIKFIYTIVNFHNPGGSTMSVERRKKLVEISKQYNIPIFEDDPYGYVRYEGHTCRPYSPSMTRAG